MMGWGPVRSGGVLPPEPQEDEAKHWAYEAHRKRRLRKWHVLALVALAAAVGYFAIQLALHYL